MKIKNLLNSLKIAVLFLAVCFSPHAFLKAQSTANYAFSTNNTGSMIDMSTGTTQHIASGLDANNSGVVSIGFTFPFMGNTFTQFSVNEDGVMQLGATSVGTNIYTITGGTAALPRLAAFNADLRTGTTTGKVHSKVIGTAPNRQLVVEFKDMQLFYTGTAEAGTSTFQMILSETTGAIDYIYGSMNATSVAAGNKSPSIGLYTGAATNLFISVAYATHTSSIVSPYSANPAVAAVGDITNLTSTADGSRRIYSFIPIPPLSPTSLTFSSVSATTMTLNWTDNATNEAGYRIFRSIDNVTFTQVAQIAPNSVTYAASSLNPSTLYYWKVIAYAEVESSSLDGNQSTGAASFAGGIKTVGSGGDYDNLTTAFADINSQALTGNVELQLITGYPATPETYPILSCNAASTGVYTVKVYPTVSGLSITSSNTTGTLNLNGATNLTFDGRINQLGAKDLVISNTNAGASYAIQLINDASSNTLQHLTIHSANNSTSSGTIVFAGSTGTTGNDNNTIDNCDIMDGASTPLNGIYSAGTSTAIDNSGNVVSNSNIFNYFGAATASNGVLLASNSSSWTINANKFYQTAARTLTSGSQHRAINVITANGNGYVITNNTIGYASSTATGVTTYTGSAGRFFGIELTASNAGTASSIQGNTISGISLTTTSGTITVPGVFAGISVLGGSVSIGNLTPNTIGASTGNGAISITTSTTANAYGIHAFSTGTLNVVNNIIGAINATGSAAGTTCGIVGINTTGGSTATTITGNTIGGATSNSIASGTLGFTTTSGTVSGIATAGGVTTLTITGNTVNNITNYANNGSSVLNGIISSGSPTTAIISNNTISNTLLTSGTLTNLGAASPTTLTSNGNTIFNASITGTTGTSTLYGMASATTQFTYNNNSIHDLAVIANAGTGASVVYGFYNVGSPTVENITNNQIYNLSITGATTSTSNIVAGIHTNTTGSSVKNFSGNVINGVSFTNSSTGTATINGISSLSGATVSIFKNKIYNLSASGASSVVNGIITPSGSTLNIYNNIIGDLKAPTASGADAVRGVSITSTSGTTNYRVYYNSIYLTASSTGTNFGTSGIFHAASATATTAALDLRNNIVINESTPSGTGITVAYRRSGVALNNYNTASNRNMFYAGIPSPSRLVMYDGTTSYQTMTAYQTAVLPRDANSFTGEPIFIGAGYSTPGNFFISTTPSNANYLQPVVGISTQAESGAVNITTPSITDDYTSAIRQGNAGYTGTGTSPDLGAFEFEGVSPTPVITLNSVTPPATTQCTAAARLVSVNIATSVGTITAATIGYSVNGVPQSNILMTNVSGTTWEGTIPVPTPANATIAWGVAAVSSIGVNGSYTGTSYSDEPLTGVTASATATATTVCAGSPTDLSATLTKLVTVQVGNGTASNSSSTAVGAFYGSYWGNGHAQILIRASELTALGISAGNITSLSVNVSALGSPTTLNNFTVKMAPTSANAITTFQAPVFTTVVTAANYTPVLGLNTHTFSTPFNWDGTSNVIVDYCFANGVTGSTSAINTMTTTTFGSFVNYNADGAGGSGACSSTTVSNTSSNRPNLIFSGNGAPAISAISWSDGVTAVGTTNPLTVNPTATTTYTATITAEGCTVAPSPAVEVTVNPLPATPTAANSSQCGVQIPTASVTSTSGLPTPTFKWYDAATGGTVMQNSASTTYTTAVASSTTFHVAEINTTTGCESPRVAVTVNVSTPDAISATPSATSICLGESVTLVAANTNPTPFQSYTYSWLSTTNSGVESATTGASIIATPTQTGSYTYDLTGVDGGCSAVASTIVTVNLNPTLVVASASDASICLGDMTDLMVTATLNTPESIINENFGFESPTLPAAWAVTNPGSGNIWTSATNAAHTGTRSMQYSWNTTNAANTWAITAPYSLIAGQDVTVSFWYMVAGATFPERLKVTVGNDATVASQTTTLWDNNGGTGLTNTTWQQATINFIAPSTGSYNFGFNCYSAADMFRLYVDDVQISSTYQEPATYDWTSTPAGFTSSVQNPIGVAPTATTTYNVEVTNNYGCSATASTTVEVNVPSTSTSSATACDSYTWNGSTYTTSGSYNWTGVNAAGCDSVATLNLTINNSTASSVSVTACDTYTWAQNSTTYTTSGMYDVTIANAIGCDSVITLNLTINNSTAATVNVTNCGPYTWAENSTTYTASGTHMVTIPNTAGCDSVITLNLTINSPSASSTSVTECDMYTWNGIDYTTSGTYTWMGTNATGCDSTATLVLTINNSSTSSTTVTECDMYTWNGVDYASSGTYTWIGTNAAGCDSTATLVLTINNSTTSTTTASDCEMYTWNGVDYTASGTYTWMGTNAAGCDSTATLVLTINSITATATDNGDATASASSGASYVWINCATNQAIAGATAQTFTPTANGSYAVVVTNAAGCSDTSNCVTISNVGIKELVDHSLNVYPNPTTGNVTVEFTAAQATVEVIDAQGKILHTQSMTSGDTISLENYERGVYFLKINSENGSALQRVVKN